MSMGSNMKVVLEGALGNIELNYSLSNDTVLFDCGGIVYSVEFVKGTTEFRCNKILLKSTVFNLDYVDYCLKIICNEIVYQNRRVKDLEFLFYFDSIDIVNDKAVNIRVKHLDEGYVLDSNMVARKEFSAVDALMRSKSSIFTREVRLCDSRNYFDYKEIGYRLANNRLIVELKNCYIVLDNDFLSLIDGESCVCYSCEYNGYDYCVFVVDSSHTVFSTDFMIIVRDGNLVYTEKSSIRVLDKRLI